MASSVPVPLSPSISPTHLPPTAPVAAAASSGHKRSFDDMDEGASAAQASSLAAGVPVTDEVDEAQASLLLSNPSSRKAKLTHHTDGSAAATSSSSADSMVDGSPGGSTSATPFSPSSASADSSPLPSPEPAAFLSADGPRPLKSTVLTSFFPSLPRPANIVNWRRRRDLASEQDTESRASQARQVASRLRILRQCFQLQDAELGLPHIHTDLLTIVAEYSARSEYEMREVVSVRAVIRPGGPGLLFSSEAEFRSFVSRTVVEEPRLQQCMSGLAAAQKEAERPVHEAYPYPPIYRYDSDGSLRSDGSQESDWSDASCVSAIQHCVARVDQVSCRFVESFAEGCPALLRGVVQRDYPPSVGAPAISLSISTVHVEHVARGGSCDSAASMCGDLEGMDGKGRSGVD